MSNKPLKWTDETSWSRSDNEEARKKPRTFAANAGSLRLVVTRHMYLAPTDWMLRCAGLHIESSVGDVSAEDAQRKLVALVKARLRQAVQAIGGIE